MAYATPKPNQFITLHKSQPVISKAERDHNTDSERGARLRLDVPSMEQWREEMAHNGQNISLPEWLQDKIGLNEKGE